MASPVSVADVEARFRLLTPSERTNAEAWIDDAWDILTTSRPALEDDIAADAVTLSTVRRVVSDMVIRKLQNPDGKIEERGDDYSFKRAPETASGTLYASDAELLAVTPAATVSGRSRNSVRLVAHGEP